MQPNGRGGVLMSVDTAELFGTPISTFRLRDGTEGTLRKDPQGKFSIKLSQAFRVVPLANAITARVARVENVGERTVVIVETQERGCAYRYEVLAFQGTDVLQWTIGNCKDRPRVELAPDARSLNIDFPNYNRLSRQIYTDSRLLNTSVPVPPGVDTRTVPFADDALRGTARRWSTADRRRCRARDSGAAGAGRRPAGRTESDHPQHGKNAAPGSTGQGGRARRISLPLPRAATPAPAAAPMIFQAEEIKPVVIDLRK